MRGPGSAEPDSGGGSISVSSEKGKGTTFIVDILLEIVSEADSVEKEKPAKRTDLKGVSALLAEDMIRMRKLRPYSGKVQACKQHVPQMENRWFPFSMKSRKVRLISY